MDEMPSSEFRKTYATLAKPTRVTVNGHGIGVWRPGGGGQMITEEVFLEPGQSWVHLASGEWLHLAVAGGIVYLNGQAVSRQAEYALYDRVLTPEEAKAHYEAAVTPAKTFSSRPFTPAPKPARPQKPPRR